MAAELDYSYNNNFTNDLDNFSERLKVIINKMITDNALRFSSNKLSDKQLHNFLDNCLQALNTYSHKLDHYYSIFLMGKNNTVNNAKTLLESLSYKNILKRGFAIVEDSNGKIISNSKAITTKQKLHLRFKDDKVKGTFIKSPSSKVINDIPKKQLQLIK